MSRERRREMVDREHPALSTLRSINSCFTNRPPTVVVGHCHAYRMFSIRIRSVGSV